METLVAPETNMPGTVVLSSPAEGTSFWKFVLRLAVAMVAAIIVLLGGLFAADSMGAFKQSTGTVTPSTPASSTKSGTAAMGYTFKDPWNVIEGPNGFDNVATRCDPLRDHVRMYMSSNGSLTFETDPKCVHS